MPATASVVAALGGQALVAAAAVGYRVATTTAPDAATTLVDYVGVALISLFIAAYGVATFLLGSHLRTLGHQRRISGALHVAGTCMVAAAAENVVEDGFGVDRLVWSWLLLIATSWVCLCIAGGMMLSVRGTRVLGLLLAAPPPVALALDFVGWLPAVFVSGVGGAIVVVRRGDRPVVPR